MYFRDVSCHVQHTVEKTKEAGVYRLLGASWGGIAVLTNDNRVHIEKDCYDFAGVGNAAVYNFLCRHAEEIRSQEESVYSDGTLHLMAVLIRRDMRYSVYTVVLTPEAPSPKDITWLRVYNTVSYENVLLKNEVSQERELVQKIFESTSIAILTMNLEGNVVAANPAAVGLFGLTTPVQNSGIAAMDWLSSMWEDILAAALDNRKYARREYPLRVRQEMQILDLIASPIKSSKGRVLGVVITCSDDTEKVLLEREVAQLNQFAILGEIATGVAHDVRNPLMNIRCSTQFLQKHFAQDLEDLETLGDIIHEVDRIDEVVEQMLTYGDIQRNKGDGFVDLNEVIGQSISIVKRFKGAKEIQFAQILDPQIPILSGRKTELQQALINLLINAVQAIPEQGRVTVRSHHLQADGRIRIVVEDTGEGIPYGLQDQLFRHFFSTRSSGVGFGLPIVKRVISSYNGEIGVASTPGVGTAITITLPTRPTDTINSEEEAQ